MTDHVRVRPARPDELPSLLELPGEPERNADTRAYLAGLLDKTCTRPEWCFLAERHDGSEAVGSAVLWALPGRAVPDAVCLVEAPWAADDGGESVALPLLAYAAVRAKAAGAAELLHVIDKPAQPPQLQHLPERREAALVRAGFARVRDGHRFLWRAGQPVPPADPRLTFRGLHELGPGPFVELLTRLLADTADQRLAADVAEHGLPRAAEVLFEESLQLEHRPEWYEIGFTDDGAAAALSLPAISPSSPVIGFVGVGPEHRWRGFSASVVARGTRILADQGADEIRGDCDRANVAMYKGFLRCGYRNFADRLELIRRLRE